MARHELKTLPVFFDALAEGRKGFEIRRNDRGFRVGDLVCLREWQAEGGYSGREIRRRVTYLTDYEQKPGFVVMSLEHKRPCERCAGPTSPPEGRASCRKCGGVGEI